MAIQSLCGKLVNGLDLACIAPARKYYQQATIINKTDIEEYTITGPEAEVCDYSVEFTLKEGTKGYQIIGNDAGSTFFGSFDKTRGELGYVEYAHNVQILIAGVTKEVKCILDALDKGSFVVALQLMNGTVEIYGMENGLSTGDYTYSIQEGGGGTAIVLTSLEDAPENHLPLIYKSGTPGSENADFDDAFENPAA